MASIEILDYQATWPQQFQAVAGELQTIVSSIGPKIEHIGSTSVPGMCAKPVLDMLLGVASLSQLEAVAPGLAAAGFVYRPEHEQQIPDRRYFVRSSSSGPRVHLHAVVTGGQLWQQHLYFRDHLRQSRPLRQSYCDLKRRLAVIHAQDKAAYTEAKAPFIQGVLASLPVGSSGAQRHV